MTKKDIVLRITDATGIKQVDVKRVVQKTFDIIVDSLVRSEKVELRNFGVFKVKTRKPRRAPMKISEKAPTKTCALTAAAVKRMAATIAAMPAAAPSILSRKLRMLITRTIQTAERAVVMSLL